MKYTHHPMNIFSVYSLFQDLIYKVYTDCVLECVLDCIPDITEYYIDKVSYMSRVLLA